MGRVKEETTDAMEQIQEEGARAILGVRGRVKREAVVPEGCLTTAAEVHKREAGILVMRAQTRANPGDPFAQAERVPSTSATVGRRALVEAVIRGE